MKNTPSSSEQALSEAYLVRAGFYGEPREASRENLEGAYDYPGNTFLTAMRDLPREEIGTFLEDMETALQMADFSRDHYESLFKDMSFKQNIVTELSKQKDCRLDKEGGIIYFDESIDMAVDQNLDIREILGETVDFSVWIYIMKVFSSRYPSIARLFSGLEKVEIADSLN